jgi:hypothetical protein
MRSACTMTLQPAIPPRIWFSAIAPKIRVSHSQCRVRYLICLAAANQVLPYALDVLYDAGYQMVAVDTCLGKSRAWRALVTCPAPYRDSSRVRLSWPMAVPVGATRLTLLGSRANITRSDGSENVKNVMQPGRVIERWNPARL